MSWISQIRSEVSELDTSISSLRKFGLTVGGVFILITVLAFWKDWADAAKWTFTLLGGGLFILGSIAPTALRVIYQIWMALAFAIGGVVSKVILTLIFFVAIVPMGLLGRFLKLPFTEIRTPESRDSYWSDRKPLSEDHYEKLF